MTTHAKLISTIILLLTSFIGFSQVKAIKNRNLQEDVNVEFSAGSVVFNEAHSNEPTNTDSTGTNGESLKTDSAHNYTDTIIHWIGVEEAMAAQQHSAKPVFLFVYANWCRWCKTMEEVWSHKEIAHYINQNFIAAKFNCEQKEPLTYKGREYKLISEEKTYVHEFALFMLNYRQTYPGFCVINSQGNVVNVKTGSMDAATTETYLNYYGSGSYREMPFEEFEDNFYGKTH